MYQYQLHGVLTRIGGVVYTLQHACPSRCRVHAARLPVYTPVHVHAARLSVYTLCTCRTPVYVHAARLSVNTLCTFSMPAGAHACPCAHCVHAARLPVYTPVHVHAARLSQQSPQNNSCKTFRARLSQTMRVKLQ